MGEVLVLYFVYIRKTETDFPDIAECVYPPGSSFLSVTTVSRMSANAWSGIGQGLKFCLL